MNRPKEVAFADVSRELDNGIAGADKSPKPNSARANDDFPLPEGPTTR